MLLRLKTPLFEAADETNGGGGATEAKPLNEEDIGKKVNASVNAAVTSQLKRMLGPAVSEALGNLDERIVEAIKKVQPEAPVGGNQDEAPKPDPRLSALESKYSELEKRYQAEQEAREAAEKKSRDEGARAALKAALEPHISGTQLDVAARYLFDAQKIVTFDEDGNPLVRSKRAPMQGMAEEEIFLPVQDGVSEWLKSEEAKIFLPPPKPGPAGRPGVTVPRGSARAAAPKYDSPATTDEEKIRRAIEREQSLKSQYGLT